MLRIRASAKECRIVIAKNPVLKLAQITVQTEKSRKVRSVRGAALVAVKQAVSSRITKRSTEHRVELGKLLYQLGLRVSPRGVSDNAPYFSGEWTTDWEVEECSGVWPGEAGAGIYAAYEEIEMKLISEGYRMISV